MIKTITLNPAIDKTVEINNFVPGAVNRVSSIRIDAGGKGINVSKMIKTLQGQSKALGVLAGKNGEYIKEYLDKGSIDNDFIFALGETRTNIKIIDKENKINTDINESGVEISKEEIRKLEEKIFSNLDKEDILVLSGSVPTNISKDIYREWIKKASEKGIKIILDADGELLREGIKGKPYLIKPNIHEMERLLGKNIESLEEIVEAGKEIINLGVKMVVVSLGEEGALYIEKDKVIKAEGLKVQVKSTVGAGDAMVAALALALEKHYSLEKTVALSMASGAAKVTTSGTQPPELKDILEFETQVRFKYL